MEAVGEREKDEGKREEKYDYFLDSSFRQPPLRKLGTHTQCTKLLYHHKLTGEERELLCH